MGKLDNSFSTKLIEKIKKKKTLKGEIFFSLFCNFFAGYLDFFWLISKKIVWQSYHFYLKQSICCINLETKTEKWCILTDNVRALS